MTNHALLFTLSAIGIAETFYFIRVRKASGRPICVIGSGCHQVLESKWNKTFGIHNDILGLLFYIIISTLTAFLVIWTNGAELWDLMVRLLIWIAALFSAYLFYLQWRVIKEWCFWCVMSAVTIYLMFLIILTTTFQ